jgi:hypothetical protein
MFLNQICDNFISCDKNNFLFAFISNSYLYSYSEMGIVSIAYWGKISAQTEWITSIVLIF